MSKALLAAATLALHVAVAHAASPSIDEHLSPGGARFVLASVPEAEDLVIQVAWPVEWAVDRTVNQVTPILATTSQFASGAEGHHPGDFFDLLEDAYAEARLTVDQDFAYGTLLSPLGDAEDVLAAVNAHLRTPRFDRVWFRRYRDSFSDFLEEKQHDPSTLAYDAIYWAAFGDHPFRRTAVFRDLDAARNVARSDLASWAAATYTSAPHALIVAGDVDAVTAGRLVDLLLHGLPGKPVPPASHPVGVPKGGRVLIHAPDAEDSYAAIIGAVTVPGEWPRHHDGFIQWTLSHSGGGILNEAVRGSLRAAYFIEAGVGEFHYDSHYLLIQGSVDAARVGSAVEELLQVYDRYVKSPSTEGLERFRSRTQETLNRQLSDPIALSHAALKAVLRGHDVAVIHERLASAEWLTPEEVRKRVREGYPDAGDLLVVVVSPDADALPGACVIEAPKEVLECDLK